MSKGWGFASSASLRAVTRVNVEQAPKTSVAGADPPPGKGRPPRPGDPNDPTPDRPAGVMTTARGKGNANATREIHPGGRAGTANRQPARDRPGRGGSRTGP